MPPAIKMQVFVEPGVERRLLVQFDPDRLDEEGVRFAEVHRVVTGADLVRDVETACRLGQITPDGVCQSLRAKADAVAKAIEKGRTRAARGAIKAFLNEQEAQAEKHVKNSALTILREEATALLNTIQSARHPPSRRRLARSDERASYLAEESVPNPYLTAGYPPIRRGAGRFRRVDWALMLNAEIS